MKRFMRYTIAALLFVVIWLCFRNHAVAADKKDDLPVDTALRTQIVDSVISFVRASYVDSATGAKAAEAFRRSQKKGALNQLTMASTLCDSLTAIFQAVRPDKHFRVLFDVEPHPIETSDSAMKEREDREMKVRTAFDAYGFVDVKRLAGNVGYIQLSKFYDPEIAAPSAAAAMALLKNTDALIIDLRNNGGGHGGMVEVLESYFLSAEPVHLMDLYSRPENMHKQRWSMRAVNGERYLDKQIYILINSRTFSAAEECAYTLQTLKRAVIVGETSRGGAHPVEFKMITEHFAVMLPVGTSVSPVTDTNWEGTGVIPDISASADQALTIAQLAAIRHLKEKQPHPELDVSYDVVIQDLEAELKETP